jgi:tetratricopeptide (TPR) repeat protein
MRTSIRWFGLLVGLALARAVVAGDRPTVCLGPSAGWCIAAKDGPNYGFLTRELARQAFLIAAREELSAVTRDVWLGDSLSESGDNPPFDLFCSAGQPSLLELTRGFGPKQRSIWQLEVPIAGPFDYPQYISLMERMSRDEFVGVLERNGVKRTIRALPKSRGDLPADVVNRLNGMSFTSQFAALRQLHALQGSDVSDDARLAALSRCYATLGVMSEYFWNPMHQVFKARALLYAERLVARDHKSSVALAHRAYARALVGMHGAALADLETTQLEPSPATVELPKWADLIADFCMFNASAMKQAREPSQQELSALLRLLMAEQSDVPGLTPRIARAESKKAPECYRITDGYLIPKYYNHPDEREEQPANGTVVLSDTLYDRLQAIRDLPAKVAAATEGHSTNELLRRESVIRELLATATDQTDEVQAEIPWALLGRLICEVSFFQAWRRPDIAPVADGGLVDLHPMSSQHRYAAFLDADARGSSEQRKAYRTFLQNLDPTALEFQEWPLYDFIRLTDSSVLGTDFFFTLKHRMDGVGRDLARRVQAETGENCLPWSRLLLATSPFHPIARSQLVTLAWDDVRKQAANWERTSASQPAVLVALGKHYAAAKDVKTAGRLLRQATDISPNAEYVAVLAGYYAQIGDQVAWVKTMEQLAALPDTADRGRVQAAITGFYMSRGQWQLAQEHAGAAIDEGTTAGLIAGGQLLEAQQNWESAEAQYSKASQSDPDFAFDWYFFCMRTGQGNVKAARQVAENYMHNREAMKNGDNPQPHLYMQIPPGAYYVLAKKPEMARQYFEEEFDRAGDPFCGMQAALLADQLKDTRSRDQRLADIAARHGRWKQLTPEGPHNEIAILASIFAADLKKTTAGELDGDAIDKLLSTANEMERINCNYFLGQYLRLHGKLEKAIDPWLKCVALQPMRAINRTLAGSALREVGITPDQYESAVKDRTPRPAADGASKK